MPRYINADDLPVTTVAIRPYAISEEPYNAEVVFARFIRTAPAADVRENIHGKWIKKYISTNTNVCGTASTVYVCSVCGAYTEKKDNFCPDCGADMRGDE